MGSPSFYLNSLDIENRRGFIAVEIAAYYGHLATLEGIISSGDTIYKSTAWYDRACESAAAGSPRVEVMEYLLNKTSRIKVDDDLIRAAALNSYCSVPMLKIILAKAPEFITRNSVLRKVARRCKDIGSLELLLSRMRTRTLDEETMLAACHNRHCSADILRLFFAHCEHFELTENFMVKATTGIQGADCCEILDILDSNGRTYLVTSRLLKAAARCEAHASRIMATFLSRYGSDEVGEDVIRAAIGNPFYGVDMLKMLTDRFQSPTVTESLLRAAVGNPYQGVEILKVLLSFPSQSDRPEEALYRAITSFGVVEPVHVDFLLERFPTVEVTDSLIRRVLSDNGLVPSSLETIFSSPQVIVVSELMLEQAALNHEPGVLKILLQSAPNCPITEDLLLAAAKNSPFGFEILNMLFTLPDVARMGDQSILAILKDNWVDVRVVKLLFEKEEIIPDLAHLQAAAYGSGLQILTYLLVRCDRDEADFLKSLLQPTSQVRWLELASSVSKVLILYLNEEVMAQEMWKEVAMKESRQSMETLLRRAEPANYQQLLDAAADNRQYGYGLVKYLLSLGKVTISKETFLAAARNGDFSGDYTEARLSCLLLQHCEPSAWCQEIALAAATNRTHGQQIVELMMKNSLHICVNQELLQASVTNPELLEYLLGQPLDGVINTMEIVKLAANGGSSGIEALLVLLRSSCSVEITEEVLQAICRTELIYDYDYSFGFRDPVAYMLEKLNVVVGHATAFITDKVIKESVKNHKYGIYMVQTLMRSPKNQVSMSQAILELAAQNEESGYELTKYIFDDHARNVKVTEKLVTIASKNIGCGEEILEFLLNRACIEGNSELIEQTITAIRDSPNGLRNALFCAAYRGHAAAFKALIDKGIDLTEQLGNVGNVLHVASFAGHLEVVKILVPYASLLDVPGGQFRSPLLAALMRDHVDIAKCLFEGGVNTDTMDSTQRTILHRLVWSKAAHNTAALLELGAPTEARDLQGYTALHHAVLGSSIPGTTALLNASTPINAQDNFGWTALHWAARKGDMKIAELLTSVGADLHCSDSEGRTPLGVAVFFGQDKLQKILWTGTGTETLELKQGIYADEIKCGACKLVSQLG